MISFFSSWAQGIIVSVIVASIIEMILPNGTSKKYIKVIIGIYILFNIIDPIINKFIITKKEDLDVSKFIDLDTYVKSVNEINKNNIESKNEENIKQIYITKLKNDIKNKLEDMEYKVNDIKIYLENDSDYTIKNISLKIIKDNKEYIENTKNNSKEEIGKIKKVEEIEEINIVILENQNIIEDIQEKDKSSLTKKEENDIKEFLNKTYNIKIQNIYIS